MEMLPLRNRNFEYRHLSVATFLAFISGNFQRICKDIQAIPILSQIEGQAIRITASGRVSETRLNVSQTCARWVNLLDICVYAKWSFAAYQEIMWPHGRVFPTGIAHQAVYICAQFFDVVTH